MNKNAKTYLVNYPDQLSLAKHRARKLANQKYVMVWVYYHPENKDLIFVSTRWQAELETVCFYDADGQIGF